ncbi:hypothetical protein C8R47DRAFT_95400 [Mycena vitilis]|nr:hypothetical protein C8R47DRAFT_95400 [Mycena vitilis]
MPGLYFPDLESSDSMIVLYLSLHLWLPLHRNESIPPTLTAMQDTLVPPPTHASAVLERLRCASLLPTATWYPRLAVTVALLLYATRGAAADNLACNGTGMNWYTSIVGETPCQTYQQLRQICNAQYTVGVQKIDTPPDNCSDQVSSCCCNTIAFALSMLCLNCQQDIGTSPGHDAAAGAYQDYLGSACPACQRDRNQLNSSRKNGIQLSQTATYARTSR